jgi:hypothetical protein
MDDDDVDDIDNKREVDIIVSVPARTSQPPVDANYYIKNSVRSGTSDVLIRLRYAMNLRQQVEEARFSKLTFDSVSRFLSSLASPRYRIIVCVRDGVISFDITEDREPVMDFVYPECHPSHNKLYSSTTQTVKLTSLVRHIQKIMNTMSPIGVYTGSMTYRMTDSLVIVSVPLPSSIDFSLDLSTISVQLPRKTLPDGRPGRIQLFPVLQTLSVTPSVIEFGFNRYFEELAMKRKCEDQSVLIK